MTSNEILKLLMDKHSECLCVPECKSGETWSANGHMRMDLWVMARSWAHPRTICYEIKVSRSDFLQDHKWPEYLQYCREFYFAAPQGIIDPAELPEEAGLILASKNGARLFVKKKAPIRTAPIPEDVYRYILMSRVELKKDVPHESRAEFWARWLAQDRELGEVGRMVSKRLRDKFEKEVVAVRQKNQELERENKNLNKFKDALAMLGMTMDDIRWGDAEGLKERIIRKVGVVAQTDIKPEIRQAILTLERAMAR